MRGAAMKPLNPFCGPPRGANDAAALIGKATSSTEKMAAFCFPNCPALHDLFTLRTPSAVVPNFCESMGIQLLSLLDTTPSTTESTETAATSDVRKIKILSDDAVALLKTKLTKQVHWLPKYRCAVYCDDGHSGTATRPKPVDVCDDSDDSDEDRKELSSTIVYHLLTPSMVRQPTDIDTLADSRVLRITSGIDSDPFVAVTSTPFKLPVPPESFAEQLTAVLQALGDLVKTSHRLVYCPSFVSVALQHMCAGGSAETLPASAAELPSPLFPELGSHAAIAQRGIAWSVFYCVVRHLVGDAAVTQRLLTHYLTHELDQAAKYLVKHSSSTLHVHNVTELIRVLKHRITAERVVATQSAALHEHADNMGVLQSALRQLQASVQAASRRCREAPSSVALNDAIASLDLAQIPLQPFQTAQELHGVAAVASPQSNASKIGGPPRRPKHLGDAIAWSTWWKQSDAFVALTELHLQCFALAKELGKECAKPDFCFTPKAPLSVTDLFHRMEELRSFSDAFLKSQPNLTWMPAAQIRSRLYLASLALALAAEGMVRGKLQPETRRFTTLPLNAIGDFLSSNFVDLDPEAHEARLSLCKLLGAQEKATLVSVWNDPMAFAKMLAQDPVAASAVKTYNDERLIVRDKAEGIKDEFNADARLLERLPTECGDGTCRNGQAAIVGTVSHSAFTASTTGICDTCQNREALLDKHYSVVVFPFPSVDHAVLYWLPEVVREALKAGRLFADAAATSRSDAHPRRTRKQSWFREISGGKAAEAVHFPFGVAVTLHTTCFCPQHTESRSDFTPGLRICESCTPQWEGMPKDNHYLSPFQSVTGGSVVDAPDAYPTKDMNNNISAATTRGNVGYAGGERVLFGVPRAELLNIRAFFTTQHRFAIAAVLNRTVRGRMMESAFVQVKDERSQERDKERKVLIATLAQTLGHCLGYRSVDHRAVLADLREFALRFVKACDARDALSVLVLCAAFAADVGRATLEFICAAAARILEHCEQIYGEIKTYASEKQPLRWVMLRRTCAIGLACLAFVPPLVPGHEDGWRQTARCYARLLLFYHRSNALAGAQAIGVADTSTELAQWIGCARLRAAEWFPRAVAPPAGQDGGDGELDFEFLKQDILPVADERIKHCARPAAATATSGWMWSPCGGLLLCSGIVDDGGNERRYDVSFFTGEVLINGAPIIGLPGSIRATKTFYDLFGDLDFEVCRRSGCGGGWVTTMDFGPALYGKHDDEQRSVFFHFLEQGSSIALEEKPRASGNEADGDKDASTASKSAMQYLNHSTEPSNLVGPIPHVVGGLAHFAWTVEEQQGSPLPGHVALLRRQPRSGTPWVGSRESTNVCFIATADSANSHWSVYQVPLARQNWSIPRLVAECFPSGVVSPALGPPFYPYAPHKGNREPHKAVYEPHKALHGALQPLLECFEPACDKISLRGPDVNTVMSVTLHRFGITFAVDRKNNRVTLRWESDADYFVVLDRQFVDWLPKSRSHILLSQNEEEANLTKPLQIALLPVGSPRNDGSIELPSADPHDTQELEHIKVWLHDHFSYVQASSLFAQRYLAAVLSVNDPGTPTDDVSPLPVAGHILLLLRQSFDNKPWPAASALRERDDGERRKIPPSSADHRACFEILAESRHPSVVLLGAAHEIMANQTAFLFHGAADQQQQQQRQPSGNAHKRVFGSELVTKALHHYRLLEKEGVLRSDCALMDDELRVVDASHGPLGQTQLVPENASRHSSWQVHVPRLGDVAEDVRSARHSLQVRRNSLNDQIRAVVQRSRPDGAEKLAISDTNTILVSSQCERGFFMSALPEYAEGLRDAVLKRVKASYKALENIVTTSAAIDYAATDAERAELVSSLRKVRAVRRKLRVAITDFTKKSVVVRCGPTSSARADAEPPEAEHLFAPFKLTDVARLLVDTASGMSPSELHEHDVVRYLTKEARLVLVDLCRAYVQACVDFDAHLRVCYDVKVRRGDSLLQELERECNSPRDNICARDYWLVFEAEQRLRIRDVQYATWNMLLGDRGDDCAASVGTVTQLNMGEGKTRVIIPMMVLSELMNAAHGRATCVHTLPTISGECIAHYRAALQTPGLRVHVLQLPFDRDVQSSDEQAAALYRATRAFSRKMFVMNREHLVSLMIKHEELHETPERHRRFLKHCTAPRILGTRTTHVWDECDELLGTDFGLVYAVGARQQLLHASLRGEVVASLLERVADVVRCWCADPSKKKYSDALFSWIEKEDEDSDATTAPTPRVSPTPVSPPQGDSEDLKRARRRRKFPAMHLVVSRKTSVARELLLRQVLQEFLLKPPHCATGLASFASQWSNTWITTFILCGEGGSNDPRVEAAFDAQERELLYLLRGLFHHGVLAFCLSRRPQEHYGVPPESRKTRLAAPYEAADLPSLRSEFAHPDVAVTLTLLCYLHHEGLTMPRFLEALKKLVSMPANRRKAEIKSWHLSQKDLIASCHGDVDLSNAALVESLHEKLRFAVPAVSFWVRCCVLEAELYHYPGALCGSAFDIASLPRAVGFSGTSDAAELLPTGSRFEPHKSDKISSATAYMMNMVLQHTVGPLQPYDPKLLEKNRGVAVAVVLQALNNNCSVVIDLGAAFAGEEMEALAKFIVRHGNLSAKNLHGVCFFGRQRNTWLTMDSKTLSVAPESSSSVRSDTCMVLFDQARCRGAEVRLSVDARALVTLGLQTTKDRLMQAVGRLRCFGKNQKIVLAASREVCNAIRRTSAEDVLRWAITNTSLVHSRSLVSYYRARTFFHKKVEERKQGNVHKMVAEALPSKLYAAKTSWKPLTQVVETLIEGLAEASTQGEIREHAAASAPAYRVVTSASQDLSETNEREICREEEHESEREVQRLAVAPHPEPHNPRLVACATKEKRIALDDEPTTFWLRGKQTLKHIAPAVLWADGLLITRNFATIVALRQPQLLSVNGPVTAKQLLLRIVRSVVVFAAQKIAVWVSEREAHDVIWESVPKVGDSAEASRTRGVTLVNLGPDWGSLTFVVVQDGECDAAVAAIKELRDNSRNAAMDALSSWVLCLVFQAMLFNGEADFPAAVATAGGVGAGCGLLQHCGDACLEMCDRNSLHASITAFLKLRGLFSERYDHSDLQRLEARIVNAIPTAATPSPS